MQEISEMMYNWFHNNDKFLSGTLDIMTINKNEWNGNLSQPRVGEKIEILDGEFYVEAVERMWSYNRPMISRLNISRGFSYSPSGEMTGEIEDLGSRLKTITGGQKVL